MYIHIYIYTYIYRESEDFGAGPFGSSSRICWGGVKFHPGEGESPNSSTGILKRSNSCRANWPHPFPRSSCVVDSSKAAGSR